MPLMCENPARSLSSLSVEIGRCFAARFLPCRPSFHGDGEHVHQVVESAENFSEVRAQFLFKFDGSICARNSAAERCAIFACLLRSASEIGPSSARSIPGATSSKILTLSAWVALSFPWQETLLFERPQNFLHADGLSFDESNEEGFFPKPRILLILVQSKLGFGLHQNGAF